MGTTQKKHIRGDRSSGPVPSYRNKRGLGGRLRVLGNICPFTLEPRENCATSSLAFKRVCSFTLEACSH
jgi:hypothetical protein